MQVSKEYHLPAYVSEKTLVIASSYSGNTEETISALERLKIERQRFCAFQLVGNLPTFQPKRVTH